MHPNRTARRLLPWAAVLTLGLCALTPGGAQPPDAKDPKEPKDPLELKNAPQVLIDKSGTLIVPLGGLVAFEPPGVVGNLTDALVGREDILGVRPDSANPKRLYLYGRTSGLTSLTVTQKDRPPLKFDVLVQPDLALLRNLIKRTVPTANVDVQPGYGTTIVLSGYVTSPQDADIVARLANSSVGGTANNVINAIQVGGVQQVQIDVVIASVDRTQLRQRGFDFILPGSGGQTAFASLVSGLFTSTAPNATPTFNGTANLQLAITPNKFFAALQALRTEGVAKFLAEPRVVTQTGRTAFFRSGGQQAILSGTSGITGPGVQLVPFGTELEVVPIVYGNGMIWLDINPRVTAVSQGLGITVNGAASPGFTEQSLRSTVLLESGQTFAIGGLIQKTVQASANKVPVLGDLPFVGVGFSSVSYQTVESELVILVTPRLVHPLDPCQAPKRLPGMETRTPDDYELFLENILEAPRGQRKVWNGKCYNAAYKCDPTVGKYPCAGNVCTGPNGTCLPAPGLIGGPGPNPGPPGGPHPPAVPSVPVTAPAAPGAPAAGAAPAPAADAPAQLPPIAGVPVGPVILPPPPPPTPTAGGSAP
jgi:pilus assembly protein CpaC